MRILIFDKFFTFYKKLSLKPLSFIYYKAFVFSLLRPYKKLNAAFGGKNITGKTYAALKKTRPRCFALFERKTIIFIKLKAKMI